MKQVLVAALVGAAALASAHATARACSFHGTVTKVTYWDDTSSYNRATSNDPRCNQSGGTQTCRLQGYYIVPALAPSGKAPTIVFIHGTGSTMPSSYCETINRFVDEGYVVMLPVMRGVAGSAPPAASFSANTGTYVVTYGTNNATSSCDATCQEIAYMKQEVLDIDSAIHWLVEKHPTTTDLSELALMGHSFGGATITLANRNDSKLTYTPTVAVSLSGAAMSWDYGNEWAVAMDAAADRARSPMYFQRVANESPQSPDIGSALETYGHVLSSGQAARLAAYPFYQPVSTTMCNDTTPNWHNVHCGFVFEAQGVAIWADGVIEFLEDYGVKP
ncbi:MAG TPA: alpha/beta fold hydrolase [Kofleriaceae bacterium]|nr:alpha/beta fold hydrolase [Kofleriaceae bacterium]